MHRFAWLILFSLLLLGADSDMAGRYTGEWKSNGAGGGGAFHITLDAQSGGAWKCGAGFTFNGEEIGTTHCTVKLEQSKLELAYDFELDGNPLHSKLAGQWNGKTFDGQYETTSTEGGDAVDDGSWQAARAK